MKSKLLQFACLTLVSAISVSAQITVGGPPPLLLPTTQTGVVHDNDETVVRARNVTVNFQLLQNVRVTRVTVSLFDTDQVVLARDNVTLSFAKKASAGIALWSKDSISLKTRGIARLVSKAPRRRYEVISL
jgi:hypothetical protein